MDKIAANSLIKRIKEGDESAFLEFYNAYHKMIKKIAVDMTGSFRDADEILSIVLEKFWRGKVKHGDNLTGYVGTVTRNAAKNYLRDNKKNREALDEVAAMEQKPIETIDVSERGLVLDQILRQLDKREREVVLRRIIFLEPFKEIAEGMGISVDAAERLFKKAVKILKPICEEIFEIKGEIEDE